MFLPRRAIAAGLLAALTAGCGVGGSNDGLEAARPSTDAIIVLSDGTRAVDRGAAEATDGTITIETGEFFFSPTVISAPAGSELTVTVADTGQNVHNFRIASQPVDLTLAEGDTETAVVHVPETGAVTFECQFHLPTNMRGEIRAV